MSHNASDAEVFVYTRDGGDAVPDDVVRVRVDPIVRAIPGHILRTQKVGRGGAQRRPR